MAQRKVILPLGLLIMLFIAQNQTHAQDTNLGQPGPLERDARTVFFLGEEVKVKSRNDSQGIIRSRNDIPQSTMRELPAIPSFSAGGDDIDVDEGERRVLAPGSYGEVEVEQNGTLFLQSGQGRASCLPPDDTTGKFSSCGRQDARPLTD